MRRLLIACSGLRIPLCFQLGDQVDVPRARARARYHLRTGAVREAFMAPSLERAWRERRTHVSDDWQALLAHPGLEVVVEASGDPLAAVEHALYAFSQGKHVVMATVEADAYLRS